MIATGLAAFAIFMLVGLTVALVGGEWFTERNADFQYRIDDALNDGLTPFDPQWTITGPGTFRIDE